MILKVIQDINRRLIMLPRRIQKYLHSLPPRRAMQWSIYWGVISLATLLIGFTAFYSQHIPTNIANRINEQFKFQPWLPSLIFVNGRDVTLKGTVEPNLVRPQEISRLKSIDGVRHVTNALEEQPSPSAEIRLSRQQNKIELRGKLSGKDFELMVQAVSASYPRDKILDRIKIDDRLGSPLWLHGLEQSLQSLKPLSEFILYGWTDALLLDGYASSTTSAKRVQYAMPATLHPGVHIDFQVRVPTSNFIPALTLISGWNGSVLSGSVPNDMIKRALDQGFNLLITDGTAENRDSQITVDSAIKSIGALPQVTELIPTLSQVRDLRLETSNNGYVLSGRVDTSEQLGQLVTNIDNFGFGTRLKNQIFIDPVNRLPEVSFFRDQHKIVINGRLPSERARADLLTAMTGVRGIEDIEEFINIEPNITYSDWLSKWSMLTSVMPKTAFGLTIYRDGLLVSGEVASTPDKLIIERALGSMFPGMQQTNWLTIAPN